MRERGVTFLSQLSINLCPFFYFISYVSSYFVLLFLTFSYLILFHFLTFSHYIFLGIIDGGTWEHRKRAREMLETAEKNNTQTLLGRGNHFMGDFLPVSTALDCT